MKEINESGATFGLKEMILDLFFEGEFLNNGFFIKMTHSRFVLSNDYGNIQKQIQNTTKRLQNLEQDIIRSTNIQGEG